MFFLDFLSLCLSMAGRGMSERMAGIDCAGVARALNIGWAVTAVTGNVYHLGGDLNFKTIIEHND